MLVVLEKQMRMTLILIPELVAPTKPMANKLIPQSHPWSIALFLRKRSYSRYGMLIFIKKTFEIVLRICSEDLQCSKRKHPSHVKVKFVIKICLLVQFDETNEQYVKNKILQRLV